jgi:hypothetical protein
MLAFRLTAIHDNNISRLPEYDGIPIYQAEDWLRHADISSDQYTIRYIHHADDRDEYDLVFESSDLMQQFIAAVVAPKAPIMMVNTTCPYCGYLTPVASSAKAIERLSVCPDCRKKGA